MRGWHAAGAALMVFGLILSSPAFGSQAETLSFGEAVEKVSSQNPALTQAQLETKASEAQAEALSQLGRPVVVASATALAYEKSLAVDLTEPRQDFITNTSAFLDQLPSQFPPGFSDIVATVNNRFEQAIPGLLAPLPSQLDVSVSDQLVRPNVSAFMPIYSGGAISALEQGAAVAASIAKHTERAARSVVELELATAYFGLLLAQALQESSGRRLIAQDRFLSDATAMEAEGLIPRSVVLEIRIVRDEAKRLHKRAKREVMIEQRKLGRIVAQDSALTVETPLFVARTYPLTDTTLRALAVAQSAQTDLAEDRFRLAKVGEKLAQSTLRPKVFAFGSYNFNRDNAVPTEPDWVAGLTASWTILSPVKRRDLIRSARLRTQAASMGVEASALRVESEIDRLTLLRDQAKDQFGTLTADLDAAR